MNKIILPNGKIIEEKDNENNVKLTLHIGGLKDGK